MSDPRIGSKVASALEFKDEVESACLQKLLVSDRDRYWIVQCNRNQNDAQLALTLPANLQYECQDLPRDRQDIFRMYIEYHVLSGMSIRTALHMIEAAMNRFLDQL